MICFEISREGGVEEFSRSRGMRICGGWQIFRIQGGMAYVGKLHFPVGGGVQTPEDTMAPGLTDSYRSAPRFYRA